MHLKGAGWSGHAAVALCGSLCSCCVFEQRCLGQGLGGLAGLSAAAAWEVFNVCPQIFGPLCRLAALPAIWLGGSLWRACIVSMLGEESFNLADGIACSACCCCWVNMPLVQAKHWQAVCFVLTARVLLCCAVHADPA